MKITAQQIVNLNSEYLSFLSGDLSAQAYRPWPPEVAPPGALVYVTHSEQLEEALANGAGIVIAAPEATKNLPKLKNSQAVFRTSSLKFAMALINPFFDEKAQRWPAGISLKAEISATATLGKGVRIGAFTVIGDDVQIGDDCSIAPHCVLERGAKIGNGTRLHPFVQIGAQCEIGARCEIHTHTSIGSDGFGYVTDPQKRHHKVPQIGKVIIEDDVELGANCSVDRATLGVTRICQGSKLDNFCHIAHNSTVGKNAMLASRFGIAGSSTAGENLTCGGDVSITDHVRIADNVLLGARSAVTKDIPEGGAYAGFPLQPWREALKSLALITNLPQMKKDLVELMKKANTPGN